MPIRIIETRSAGTPGESRIFIGSTALSLLEAELQAYCERRVDGRSFLIAGHRGAGKTTLVDAAMQRVGDTFLGQRARQVPGNAGTPNLTLRPLIVPLQGPNLLPDTQDGKSSGSTSGAGSAPEVKTEGASTNSPASPSGDKQSATETSKTADAGKAEFQLGSTETVLVQIILGLYRALANEFIDAYTSRIYEGFPVRYFDGVSDVSPGAAAMLELAAQFELDLDEYPGQARLREYWRRIDALESGILFPGSADRRLGNGYRELVALASACEAYQRICGHFTRSQETNSNNERESRAALELEAKGNALLKPLAALLSGGAVGAGLSAVGAGSALATFAGAITALLSTVAVRYSASRSKRQAMNRSELFIPDLSVATLDRVLPVLIQRILRAGLAPVFVVDELDKVDLSDRITDMVKRLKKLVAERAFFCFLTDRKYFEELSGRTAETPYPIEYTYYSHQIFIVYDHRDLHRYLNEVLQVTQAATTEAPAPAIPQPVNADATSADSPTKSPTPSSPTPPQILVNDDALDVQVLPYLILHASQMHTIDVRRRLLELRNDYGEVSYKPGEARSHPRFRYALLVQLAIETALETPDMLAELQLRTSFLQIARDALYYISRCWEHCPKDLDLTNETGRGSFELYLRRRMETSGAPITSNGPPTAKPSRKKTSTPALADSKAQASEANSCSIEPATLDFLFSQVRALAVALSDVEKVRVPATGRGIASVVLQTLPIQPLLYQVGEDSYRWHCYPSGRNVVMAAPGAAVANAIPPRAPAPATWKTEVGIIEELVLGLSDLLEGVSPAGLSNSLGILPATPAWAATEAACTRLSASEATEAYYSEIETDIACVREYTTNLRQNAGALAQTLIFSGILSSKDYFKDDFSPLFVVANLLRLRNITAIAVRMKVKVVFDELLAKTIKQPILLPESQLKNRIELARWLRQVVEIAKSPERSSSFLPDERAALIEEAWSYWKSRLNGSTVFARDPGLPVLYCALQFVGPGPFLSMDPADLSISLWSHIFLQGLRPYLYGSSNLPQPWLVLHAAMRLGLGSAVVQSEALMNRIGATSDDVPAGIVVSATLGAAALVIGLKNSRAYSWLPKPEFPILYMPYISKGMLAFIPDLKQLGFTLLALDGEGAVTAALPDAKPQSPPALENPFDGNADVAEAITTFGFTMSEPIPVIVNDPIQKRTWAPNYRPITPAGPEELFRVSQALRESAPKIA